LCGVYAVGVLTSSPCRWTRTSSWLELHEPGYLVEKFTPITIGIAIRLCSMSPSRGWKRPLRVCKSDVPEENLTLSLLLRSRTVVESKVRGLSFHLLYQRPFFVIVEANAGSRKLAKVTNTPKTTPGRPVCLSIEPQHYALKPGFWCELTSVYDSPTSSIKI